MSLSHSPRIVTGGLVLCYDAANLRSFRGEPTTNILHDVIAAAGGSVSYSYGTNIYETTALETNVTSTSAPGGSYSKFVGQTASSNNQVFWTCANAFNAKLKTVTFSTWLKGSGTCHLTIYDDVSSYGTGTTITLTDTWTQYSYTKTCGNYTSTWWPGVRGLLTSTTVYISKSQVEEKNHSTFFVDGTRGSTVATGGGCIDLSGNGNNSDLATGQTVSTSNLGGIIFNGTSDYWRPSISHSYKNPSCCECLFKILALPETGKYGTLFGYCGKSGYSSGTQGLMYICNNRIRGSVITASQVYRQVNSTVDLVTNGVYLAALNKDTVNGTLELFVNGESVSQNTFDAATYAQWSTAGSWIGEDKLDVGQNVNTGQAEWIPNYFNGIMYNLRVYSRILTAAEVWANYRALKGRYGL